MEYGSFATFSDGVWTSLFHQPKAVLIPYSTLIIYLVVSTQLSVISTQLFCDAKVILFFKLSKLFC